MQPTTFKLLIQGSTLEEMKANLAEAAIKYSSEELLKNANTQLENLNAKKEKTEETKTVSETTVTKDVVSTNGKQTKKRKSAASTEIESGEDNAASDQDNAKGMSTGANPVTKENMIEAIQKINKTKGLSVARSLLQKFGVERISQLKPAHYADVVIECNNLLLS